MKVFISWSGPLSRQLGEAIRDWLPGVLQSVKPYFTPSDIEKGQRWSSEIAKELESSEIGILCITRDNLSSDWVLFEAGALSKSLSKSHVCPILFGINDTDLTGPLKQFQATKFEKEDFRRLLTIINSQLPENKLPAKTLDTVFEKWWPDLESSISTVMKEVHQNDEPIRSDREMLTEILSLSRLASKNRGRTGALSPIVAEDLVDSFVSLHDQQANSEGTYGDAMELIARLSKPIMYIVRRLAPDSENGRKSLERLTSLDYEVIEKSEEDDPPF